jgi:predicted DNA-binding transcriptional regulator AlpA
MNQTPEDRIVRGNEEVESIVGLGKTAIRSRVVAGTFPAPVVLGRRKDGRPSLVGWRMSDLQQWIAELERQNRSKPQAPETRGG